MSGSSLRAPSADGVLLAEPPLSSVAALLADNRHHLHQPDHHLLGRPWPDMRRQARAATLAAARRYLEEAGEDPILPANPDHLLLAGHQPELFHPGVWVKNFALNGLARAHGLTPLNLVIDNDTVKTTALRLPSPATVASDRPHTQAVPFDRWTGEAPYEERPVADPTLFASFADRAGSVLRRWEYEPLLPDFWQEVRRQHERTPLLGECFAAARRRFERRWGCVNLEVPIHLLAQTEPFLWFACSLLAELPRFHAVYNDTVRAYRRRYGIRSRNHPVPDLVEEDGFHEAPFWGWRRGQSRRGRLLARRTGERIELRVGPEQWPTLPLPRGPSGALDTAWHDLEQQGFRLRPRALTTTLYARLFLADLFLHGIGGGKYDELTDALIRHFYQCTPPAFLVLSGTLWLPLPAAAVGADDCRRLARTLRDLHWNPQRHLEAASADLRTLQARKAEWIARPPADPAGKRERFEALRALTEQLRAPLAERAQDLRGQLTRCRHAVAANSVLRRRDYAFCLYPEARLRPFCTQLLSGA